MNKIKFTLIYSLSMIMFGIASILIMYSCYYLIISFVDMIGIHIDLFSNAGLIFLSIPILLLCLLYVIFIFLWIKTAKKFSVILKWSWWVGSSVYGMLIIKIVWDAYINLILE